MSELAGWLALAALVFLGNLFFYDLGRQHQRKRDLEWFSDLLADPRARLELKDIWESSP